MAVKQQKPEHPVKLCIGDFTADILPSNTNRFWFFVVQPIDSREIIAIDRCDTYEQARDAAYKVLARLNNGPTVVPRP